MLTYETWPATRRVRSAVPGIVGFHTATFEASNFGVFGPRRNFGPLFALSVVPLSESCSKLEQNQALGSRIFPTLSLFPYIQ
jgi:hypothetical protein